MPTTEQLIEKYKLEMQQMISKVNTKKDSQERNIATESKLEPPQIQTPPKEPEPQPEQAETFPEFVNRGDELTRRIEEILMQNNDVAVESDMPQNIIKMNMTAQTYIDEPNANQNNDFTLQNNTGEQAAPPQFMQDNSMNNNSPPANTGSISGNENIAPPPLTDFANLIIDVFTANRAIPIPNAVVRIRDPKNNSILAVLTTDENGSTTQTRLAAPNRELSQISQFPNPFVNYYADIRADGYVPQSDLRIQLFGGENTRLPANLIPREEI